LNVYLQTKSETKLDDTKRDTGTEMMIQAQRWWYRTRVKAGQNQRW